MYFGELDSTFVLLQGVGYYVLAINSDESSLL